jgi:hypothetical protein
MCDAKASYSHEKSQKSPKEAGAHRVGADDGHLSMVIAKSIPARY